MDTIYRGYRYSFDAENAAVTYVAYLFNAPTGSRLADDGKSGTSEVVTFTFSAENTALLPVGNYSLEIRDSANNLVYQEDNFAKVVKTARIDGKDVD